MEIKPNSIWAMYWDSMVWGRVKIHRQGYEGGSRQGFGEYDQNFCVKFSKINNAHVNEQLSGNCNPTQRTIGNEGM